MHASARYCTLPRTILICLLRNIVERHKTLKGRVVYKLHPVSHIQMCAYEERCSLWEGRRHWDEVIARSRHRREKSFDVSRNLGKARTFNAHGRKGGSFHFNDLSPAHCRANDGGSRLYTNFCARENTRQCVGRSQHLVRLSWKRGERTEIKVEDRNFSTTPRYCTTVRTCAESSVFCKFLLLSSLNPTLSYFHFSTLYLYIIVY